MRSKNFEAGEKIELMLAQLSLTKTFIFEEAFRSKLNQDLISLKEEIIAYVAISPYSENVLAELHSLYQNNLLSYFYDIHNHPIEKLLVSYITLQNSDGIDAINFILSQPGQQIQTEIDKELVATLLDCVNQQMQVLPNENPIKNNVSQLREILKQLNLPLSLECMASTAVKKYGLYKSNSRASLFNPKVEQGYDVINDLLEKYNDNNGIRGLKTSEQIKNWQDKITKTLEEQYARDSRPSRRKSF